ncbi:protein Daple isoform X1 [Aricia agestis]|uniref:protein Daple isoform X1 n=1 Tax=Aricia agestis TaxID=91739 RepID=UPI001C204AC8|nr:protein Daple isoform X1 [Aricia agestis]
MIEQKDNQETNRNDSSQSNMKRKVTETNSSGSTQKNITAEKQAEKGVSNVDEININREDYLQIYKNLLNEVNQLQIKNSLFHRRLAEYFRKRHLEHVLKPIDSAELEEKYQQKLMAYEELTQKEEKESTDIKLKLDAVEIHYRGTLEQVQKSFDVLQEYERSAGTGLILSSKGKPISDKMVERLLTLQRRKTEQASALCLRYIRARNAVAELETIVHKLERLAPGLYVSQYEQLNFEHQNYKSKIEEREDELIKNRKKCTEHNQILAHIREKMNHTDEIIDIAEGELGDAQVEFMRAREKLGETKSRRDKLRWALEEERLKAGLLTKKDMLRDYQDATDEVSKLKDKKDVLQKAIGEKFQQIQEARRRMKIYECQETLY